MNPTNINLQHNRWFFSYRDQFDQIKSYFLYNYGRLETLYCKQTLFQQGLDIFSYGS